ncbi:SDR family oxidoreductase [Rhodobacteraceae bacterium KMM 6894]|nr:SDR family oxidoreductase [Rhodobacteraceae bacterium KMM 6894]
MHVVITGASRGIGAGLANLYTQRGDQVTGTSRSGVHPLDVTDPDAHSQFSKSLKDATVDLLICNAGVYLDKGQALDDGYPLNLWADTFAANVTGVFLSVQAMLPHLEKAERPKIAIVSSIMASDTEAPGGSYIYRASKAAVLNLGRNLAVDLRPRGIAVGIYHPGWVRTDMGGSDADISLEDSVTGLSQRFDALDIDSTGCFLHWDGTAQPF